MSGKEEIVELNEEEARLANYYPRFPLRLLPDAIEHMRSRQYELQNIAEERLHDAGTGTNRPISIYAVQLGELIDRLEKLT